MTLLPLPSVLDIHLVWHPSDSGGDIIAQEIEAHFQHHSCTGLQAGTVEVYRRCAAWRSAHPDHLPAPRPVPLPGEPGAALHTLVVVLVSTALMREVQESAGLQGGWHGYLDRLVTASKATPEAIKVVAVLVPGTRRPTLARLSDLLGENQYLAEPDRHALRHHLPGWRDRARCRELAQTLSCWLDPKHTGAGIQVFISHTKQSDNESTAGVGALVRQVRAVLGETRLGSFYDAHSLQPGQGWANALTSHAQRCALLVLRTDLYATREWCHREVTEAKQHGCPVVMLDALSAGESRGSYLLDHVPRLPVRAEHDAQQRLVRWSDDDIERGINRLMDAWLERVLWRLQQQHLSTQEAALKRHRWFDQAPEPLTLVNALRKDPVPTGQALHIIHPDPPLSDTEQEPLSHIASLLGHRLHITTPRMHAAAPVRLTQTDLATPPLANQRIGMSTSTGSPDVLDDLARLGLTVHHHDLVLRAMARAVLVHGGTLAYGGHLKHGGCTPILMDEVERYAHQQQDSTPAGTPPDLTGERAPLWMVLAWNVHREHTLAELRAADAALSLHGRLRCLDMQGEVIDMAAGRSGLTEDAVPKSVSKEEGVRSLTAMRRHLDTETQARVVMGGKREGFEGKAPGLLEEAILALDQKRPSDRRPLYLIGGMGGITAHMVAEMDPGHPACAELADPGVVLDTKARRAMKQFLSRLGPVGSRWATLGNGLSDDENRQLATSNRPAEIAALICRGLQQVKAMGAVMPVQAAG